ncbi:hypothetical protein [Actinoplanes sp. HUAS TT8]|uniref:hypothetical protein n=1 Tax=Actinoplanes sp. HUAS TT8 TaxID=3447453 RepID=UPI003F51F326
MKKRVILYGIAVVLVGVVAADLISGGKLIRLPRTEDSIAEEFLQINAKLQKAGTARVAFEAQLGGAYWKGTSTVRFGNEDDARWDTTYQNATAGTKNLVGLRRVHTGFRKDFYTSPDVKPKDGRTWFTPEKANLGTDATSPQSNLADITTWLPFIAGANKYHAGQAKTDALDNLKDAPDEYRFYCNKDTASCPPFWDTPLDNVFNTAPIGTIYDIWLDEDGRLRRMEVTTSLDYQNGDGSRDLGRLPAPLSAKLTFEVSDFGAKLDAQAPAASDLTTTYVN